MSPHDREQLRAMVREVIRDTIGARAAGAADASVGAATVEPVRLATDADLDAFVRRLAGLLRDPAALRRIESGIHRFTLAAVPSAPTPAPAARTGLIGEKAIDAVPEGAVLRLAPDAVVTPLARDRARQRRIKLERVR